MDDTPYTTPDEDPFNVTPLPQHSTLLDNWINQHLNPTPALQISLDSPSQPSATLQPTDDTSTLRSYVLIEQDDIPSDSPNPVTPIHTPRHASRILHRAASFRNFNIPFRSSSPGLPTTHSNDSPRPSSRLSFLSKSSRTGANSTPTPTLQSRHTRSHSLSTVQAMPDDTSTKGSIIATPSRWRPSVLGHFSTPSRSSGPSSFPIQRGSPYTPPRPSISSADTYTTGAAPSDNDLGKFFSKLSLVDSIRSRGDVLKSRVASTSSLWSSQSQTVQTSTTSPTDSPRSGSPPPALSQWSRGPTPFRPYATLFDEELGEIAEECEQPYAPLKPSTKPQIAYSAGGGLTRMRFTSLTRRHKKKRRLVVSGIKPNDVRKFENLKAWCESFGEVSQITRMPNTDLHVHFRRSEVADTVCRLRAKVFINGVGSVQLSWTYGDKR